MKQSNIHLALLLLIAGLLVNLIYQKQSDDIKAVSLMTSAPYYAATSNINSNSKFDLISKQLYEKSIATTTATSASNRKPFVLDSNWERGTGGLDDADRKTIGELYYKASSVFEFGIGESTFIAAAVKVPRYAGVDSDAIWVTKARKAAIDNEMDHFRFYFSDIGETLPWGYPEKEDLAKNEYDYQVAALMAETRAFDVYLVDGRYRLACACLSFLHAIKYGHGDLSNVQVGIHDNHKNSIGRHYEIFQEVADVKIRNKKLWVYKLKADRPNIEQEVYDLWERIRDKVKR